MGNTATRLDSNTVTFRDGPEQWSVGMGGSGDSTRHVTVHDDVSLDQFFARPIPLYSATWSPGSAFTAASFNPWYNFISNVRVANRMSNYKLFSGTMHVKFMINGNSFYYGRIMASYAPYYAQDIATSTALGTISSLIQNSQRLKLFIDPCESQAGEIELPFIWHADMVNLVLGEYSSLGLISLEELVGLKHANGASSAITITAFGWMTDVKLSAPTVQDILSIAPQAGDEYGSSNVSSIASSVAAASGKLSNVPMIGPYMKATSMAAGAMAGVAKMFGFSRPVDLLSATPMRQRTLGELACTDVSDASVKLTVDSKQELSIDPSIVGSTSKDELTLVDIASRESYVAVFPWTTAALTDALLYNFRVNPMYSRSITGTLGNLYTIPACTYAAIPFRYWRGTMRYRFMIVASSFHKGRLKFVWDPSFANVLGETNVQYTKIVDIANERDFVIDVSWGQERAWLNCMDPKTLNGTSAMGTGRFTSNALWHNGVLSVYVLNELSTPNSAVNNDIQINVFMSMCDDAQFAAPSGDIISTMSPADGSVQPQSGSEDVENEQLDMNNAPEQPVSTEEYVDCNPTAGPESLVYMGERITSLRQLIKRYAVDYHYSAVTPGVFRVTTSDFPMKFGYTPFGIRGTSPAKYDVANTTMLRYCAMGFLFFRGGIRRKYIMQSDSSNQQFSNMSITRVALVGSLPSAPSISTLTLTNATTLTDTYKATQPTGLNGMTMTTVRQNPVIEAETPYYKDVRFSLCRRPNSVPTAFSYTQVPYVEDLLHSFSATIWSPATAVIFTSLVSAAEDASFFCFQGCQPFYNSPTLV